MVYKTCILYNSFHMHKITYYLQIQILIPTCSAVVVTVKLCLNVTRKFKFKLQCAIESFFDK